MLRHLRDEVRTGKIAGYFTYFIPTTSRNLTTNYGIFILISGSSENLGSSTVPQNGCNVCFIDWSVIPRLHRCVMDMDLSTFPGLYYILETFI